MKHQIGIWVSLQKYEVTDAIVDRQMKTTVEIPDDIIEAFKSLFAIGARGIRITLRIGEGAIIDEKDLVEVKL